MTMQAFRLLSVLFAGSVLLALGCGSETPSDEDPMVEGPPPANLVGVWTYQSVTVNGTPSSLADVLEWVPGAVRAELQLFESSAFAYQEVNESGAQLWSESGFVFFNDAGEVDVNVQMNSDGPADEMSTFTYTASGDTLTLSQVGGADAVVFTLVR